jgi:Protein of unknown function (DUF3800)
VPTFYIDETGFTGEDLMEPNQTIFVEATHDYTEAETSEIINSIFKDVHSDELKFRALSRRPAHQARVIEFIEQMAKAPNRVASWVAHKEYAMLTMVVEWWVEPLAHQTGLNLYKDGGNQALANMMFACTGSFWDEKFRRKLLLAFQKTMRARTKERFDECYEIVQKAKADAWGDEKRTTVLNYYWHPLELLGFGHVGPLPNHVLDLALPGLARLGLCWRSRHEGPWEVVHDASSNMARQKWLWDALSSPRLEKAEFAGPHGASVFPMNVTSTTFSDSKAQKQLQLCDILAGAIAASVRLPEEDEFRKKLHEAGILDLVTDTIWPSLDVTPQELDREGRDGNEMIEWLSGQMAKTRAGAATGASAPASSAE